jgi:hypothetical protein
MRFLLCALVLIALAVFAQAIKFDCDKCMDSCKLLGISRIYCMKSCKSVCKERTETLSSSFGQRVCNTHTNFQGDHAACANTCSFWGPKGILYVEGTQHFEYAGCKMGVGCPKGSICVCCAVRK